MLAAVVLGVGVYEEDPDIALPFSALSALAGLVYLVRATRSLGDQKPPRGDHPFWLIAAGTVWLVALFVPDGDYVKFDKGLVLEVFDDDSAIAAVAMLLAGLVTAGAGLLRHRSARPVWLITAVVFAVIMAITAGVFIAPTPIALFSSTSWDYAAASVLAVVSLTFALAYLADLVRTRLRRRRTPAEPSPGVAGDTETGAVSPGR
ncbi:MAG: hypothetical protein GEV11_00760 [Streptosporangiales bacterium]|nr:hypothetical protein [Streptosporangiales bacterium]